MRYALCAAVAVATGLCFFCYGPPLVATALRPSWLFRGVLSAAAATFSWKVLKRLIISILAQDKPRLMMKSNNYSCW